MPALIAMQCIPKDCANMVKEGSNGSPGLAPVNAQSKKSKRGLKSLTIIIISIYTNSINVKQLAVLQTMSEGHGTGIRDVGDIIASYVTCVAFQDYSESLQAYHCKRILRPCPSYLKFPAFNIIEAWRAQKPSLGLYWPADTGM